MEEVTEWLLKQINEGNKVALLIPARTDTKYFYDLAKEQPFIIYIKGRLKFNEKGCAPFPSILMIFNAYIDKYYANMTQEQLIKYIYENL